MGQLPAEELKTLINGRTFMANLPTGYKGKTIEAIHGERGRCIVRMPHPSQFKLFGRGEPSEQAAASLRLAAGIEG